MALIATLTFMVSLNSFADPEMVKVMETVIPIVIKIKEVTTVLNKGHQNVNNQQDGFSSRNCVLIVEEGLSVSITYDDARALAIKRTI